MILLYTFAFISGLVTILTPCIWPILPIVLTASTVGRGGKKRPLGVTLGLMISFAVFTLAISSLVRIFHIDPNWLRLLAVFVIGFMGLSMIIPRMSLWMDFLVSRATYLYGQKKLNEAADFWAGLTTGLSLGLVWSPCAGPILSSIAILAATGKVTVETIIVTIAYVIGVGIPLFLFAYGGQKVIRSLRGINRYTGVIQRGFGVIMLLTAVAIYTNYDKTIQQKLLERFPSFSALTSFEGNPVLQKQLEVLKGKPAVQLMETKAPELVGITNYLNVNGPFTLADYRGKVILVDFWTYTCINCIRTLPHLNAWYEKYKDAGFVIVGVHTPEFEFEKDTGNVKKAIVQFGIKYPVVQDNNYGTWNNYNNQYWPADYLIDANGVVRKVHDGEGNYDETEKFIQQLLTEAGHKVDSNLASMPDQTPQIPLSPETYFGSDRMQYYYPTQNLNNGKQTFTLTDKVPRDNFSLGGEWTINSEQAISGKGAQLNYRFYANKVFMVIKPGTAGAGAKIRVTLDGKIVESSQSGGDVKDGVITIDSDRLYSVIDLKNNPGDHLLELDFLTPGIEIYTFTFG